MPPEDEAGTCLIQEHDETHGDERHLMKSPNEAGNEPSTTSPKPKRLAYARHRSRCTAGSHAAANALTRSSETRVRAGGLNAMETRANW